MIKTTLNQTREGPLGVSPTSLLRNGGWASYLCNRCQYIHTCIFRARGGAAAYASFGKICMGVLYREENKLYRRVGLICAVEILRSLYAQRAPYTPLSNHFLYLFRLANAPHIHTISWILVSRTALPVYCLIPNFRSLAIPATPATPASGRRIPIHRLGFPYSWGRRNTRRRVKKNEKREDGASSPPKTTNLGNF